MSVFRFKTKVGLCHSILPPFTYAVELGKLVREPVRWIVAAVVRLAKIDSGKESICYDAEAPQKLCAALLFPYFSVWRFSDVIYMHLLLPHHNFSGVGALELW